MSLYRRSKKGVFWYRFQYQGREYRGTTGTNQRRAAEQVETNALANVALGVRSINKARVMFSEACRGYERRLQESGRARKYLVNVTHHVAFWQSVFGDVSVDAITRPGIETAKRKLMEGRGTASVNRYLATLRAALAYEVEAEHIDRNPAAGRGLFLAEPAPRDRVLSTAEEAAILQHCETPLRQFVVVASMTGCRAGELAGLRWDDRVNLRDRVIAFSAEDTKTRRARTVPLNQTAVETLMTLPRSPDGFVFAYSEGYLGKLFQRAVKTAGVQGKVTLYTLRHTVGTRLDAAGVPVGVRSALLGHAVSGTTLKHYTHPDFESLRRAVQVLETWSADAKWSAQIPAQAPVSY